MTWDAFLSFGALAKVDNMADPERIYDGHEGDIVTARSSCLAVLTGCWILLSWCATHAADITYSKDFERCIAASNGNALSIIECTTAETALWDKRPLSASWNSTLSSQTDAYGVLEFLRREAPASRFAWLLSVRYG